MSIGNHDAIAFQERHFDELMDKFRELYEDDARIILSESQKFQEFALKEFEERGD